MMKLKLGDDDDAPTLGGFNRALRIERNRTVRRGGVLYARPRARQRGLRRRVPE